jgi:hypothetical protein
MRNECRQNGLESRQKVYETGLNPEKRGAPLGGETLKHEEHGGRFCGDTTDARLAIGRFREDIPGRRRLRWTIPAHRLETVAVA